ncbi:hypothetical protein [Aestuariivita boseongensis]|uniref:hypothetical protein n=1 Tax=Aestuariivita boseongensis TaxID=1470562 RepID=UPI0012FACDBF|nr:hypothetical protein [Aestuariivita boseongensis]
MSWCRRANRWPKHRVNDGKSGEEKTLNDKKLVDTGKLQCSINIPKPTPWSDRIFVAFEADNAAADRFRIDPGAGNYVSSNKLESYPALP